MDKLWTNVDNFGFESVHINLLVDKVGTVPAGCLTIQFAGA